MLFLNIIHSFPTRSYSKLTQHESIIHQLISLITLHFDALINPYKLNIFQDKTLI